MALDVLDGFPPAVEQVLETEFGRTDDPATLTQFVQDLLRQTVDVTSFAENWLFGSPRIHDEQSLIAAVEHEARALGLGERAPIIVPGAADNFATALWDLQDFVFEGLRAIGWQGETRDDRFVLLQVPEFEGRGGPWRPIILGHELAHLAVEHHRSMEALGLAARMDLSRVPLETDEERLRYLNIAEAWATELLCDVHAVRRFGPAGMIALAEFLTSVGARDVVSASHPPASLRLHLLRGWLGDLPPRYAHVLAPWESLASPTLPVHAPPWVSRLVEELLDIADALYATADWAPHYAAAERDPFVAQLEERLVGGIPGAVHLPANGAMELVDDADVVNAGWLARGVTDDVPVDALVAKNLDSLALVQRWKRSGGELEPISQGTEAPTELESSAVLSRNELQLRLGRSDDRALVVTPLLAGGLGAAGLDVRLGNRFIVFQRSATAFYDPLDVDDDPRSVQREVVRTWGEPFILHPGELVLAATIEYLRVPRDLTAQVITRSSYGRLGLITATAVQVNPGFRGCLTLELVNLGEVPLRLTPGERVAQLTFSPTTGDQGMHPTKYDCPTGPQFSAVHRDPDAAVLRALRTS